MKDNKVFLIQYGCDWSYMLSTYEIQSCSHSEIKVLQVTFMCGFSFCGVSHHSAELVFIICPNDPVSGQCPQMRVLYQL